MYTAASYIQHSNGYPSFFSYARTHSTYLSSHTQIPSDNEDENQSSFKKRSRTIPAEDKDAVYYEKRTRNNESAKRSRDGRRTKEQQIQERVNFLEHENSRLSMENQAIRYQLGQLHTLCSSVSNSSQ